MGGTYERITIAEFNRLCRENQFVDGPWMDTFGDNYGDPYIETRRVFGTLKDGRKVESEKGGKL